MNDLNQLRLKILEDTVKYYSEDPEGRRCLDEDGDCLYSPETAEKTTSGGCAIGRLIPRELANMLDKRNPSGVGVVSIMKYLPKDLTKLGGVFLNDLQSLHDTCGNWCEKGLSVPLGVHNYKRIKRRIIEEDYPPVILEPEESKVEPKAKPEPEITLGFSEKLMWKAFKVKK